MLRILAIGLTAAKPRTSKHRSVEIRMVWRTQSLKNASTFEVFHSSFEASCSTFEPMSKHRIRIGMRGSSSVGVLPGQRSRTSTCCLGRPIARRSNGRWFDFRSLRFDFRTVSALASSRFPPPCPNFESSNFLHVPCSIRWRRVNPPARAEPMSLVPIASHCHRTQRPSPRRGRNEVKDAPGVDRASTMAAFGLRVGQTKSDGP
jgi:hypothetical protein